MLGALFAAGFGPDALERYTWDQIALMVECMTLHRMAVMEPIMAGLTALTGGKWRRGRVTRGKPRRPTAIDYSDLDAVKRAQARDARILAMASSVDGISLEM